MATNDDLDDFFKKKDRKGHKNKKQTGILTNNEELLKQLVIVTSATTAFKENADIDEDDEDYGTTNDAVVGSGLADEQQIKQPSRHKSKTSDDTTNSKTSNGQVSSNLWDSTSAGVSGGGQQQDDWEEFIGDNSKYEQIRSKLGHTTNDYDDNDDFYDDHDDNNGNRNSNTNETNSTNDYSKDKPVWKISEIKQSNETQVPQVEDKVEETPIAKPAPSTGAYRPPQLRGSTTAGSVTVVSGINQRTNKKKEPNLASTDEFPTLGATVNKK